MEKNTKQSEITLARTSSSLQEIRRFLRESLERSRMDDYERGLVCLAVDEVVSAVVENASSGEKATIHMSIDITSVAVKVEIEDSQNYFGNGLGEETLVKVRDNDSRREIAVYFICEIMDEIYYTYQKGFENRLVMIKFIN